MPQGPGPNMGGGRGGYPQQGMRGGMPPQNSMGRSVPPQQQQQRQGKPAPQRDNTQASAPAGPTITAAALASAGPAEQKQMLGEALYPRIHESVPALAGKITGMLLEMDNGELVRFSASTGACATC